MITVARHARPGQPRRLRVPRPADPPAASPTLALPAVVLDASASNELREYLAGLQWGTFRALYGEPAAAQAISPARGRWRRARRLVRLAHRTTNAFVTVAFIVALGALVVIAGGPFWYAAEAAL